MKHPQTKLSPCHVCGMDSEWATRTGFCVEHDLELKDSLNKQLVIARKLEYFRKEMEKHMDMEFDSFTTWVDFLELRLDVPELGV